MPRRGRRRRMRVDVDQPAVDLAVGRPAVDRRNGLLERPVVEDRAVEERGFRRIDAGLQVTGKSVRDEPRPLRPVAQPLGDDLVHLDDTRRWKRTRERRGRARRKGKSGRIVEFEVAVDFSTGMAMVGKMQNVVVIELVNQRGIVNLNKLLVAVIIGDGHEQIERMTGRKQRRRGALRRTQGGDGVVHQRRHHAPVERRLEPARAHKQRELLTHLQVIHQVEPAGLGGAPDERLEEPLAPIAGARVGGQQHRNIGVVEPQIAQRIHRQVVRQRPRQHGAVDAAGGCARDDVDHDAQFDAAADLAQQIEVHLLGIVFGIVAIPTVEVRSACAYSTVRNGMQRARCAHQFQDFLGDAVHVDGKRNAAEADQRDAKFLFAQDPALIPFDSQCLVVRS